MESSEWQLREELAAAYRICVRHGFHEAIDNHLSVVLANQPDQMLINPYPLHWAEIQASNLMLGDLNGNKIRGDHEIERTAAVIHGSLHRLGIGYQCVMHTHMPFATAISCREKGRLIPSHQHFSSHLHQIAYLDDYDGEVLTEAQGEQIAAAMAGYPILFLANHGVICADVSVPRAFQRLYFLERACQFQILAESGEHMIQPLSATLLHRDDRRGLHADQWTHAEQFFAAERRLLDRTESDYRQ